MFLVIFELETSKTNALNTWANQIGCSFTTHYVDKLPNLKSHNYNAYVKLKPNGQAKWALFS